MKIIETQKCKYAEIDNVDFAGFYSIEHLAYFQHGITYALNRFIEYTLFKGEILHPQTANDISFAMEGLSNTTDYIFSRLVGHIHDLESELGFSHNSEIDLLLNNQEGGNQ